ncbi:MAG: hypothetical protein ACP5D6_06500 [Kosmotogaceae bacterium]
MPMNMIIPDTNTQIGMVLEQLDGVDAKIDEHYAAIGELINDKFTLNRMLESLKSTQGGETVSSAVAYSVHERLVKHQRQLAEIDDHPADTTVL